MKSTSPVFVLMLSVSLTGLGCSHLLQQSFVTPGQTQQESRIAFVVITFVAFLFCKINSNLTHTNHFSILAFGIKNTHTHRAEVLKEVFTSRPILSY
jgi:hypothetical protein